MPGAAITVSGTPISLDPDLVIGTSTEGLGGFIVSGNGGGTAPSNTGAEPLGSGTRIGGKVEWLIMTGTLVLMVVGGWCAM